MLGTHAQPWAGSPGPHTLGTVLHASNPSTREKAAGSETQGDPWLHSEFARPALSSTLGRANPYLPSWVATLSLLSYACLSFCEEGSISHALGQGHQDLALPTEA